MVHVRPCSCGIAHPISWLRLFFFFFGKGRRWLHLGALGNNDALYIDAGLSQHLDLRARPAARARGQVIEERCQGERGPRERDMVRDRAAHAQHVRRGGINLC